MRKRLAAVLLSALALTAPLSASAGPARDGWFVASDGAKLHFLALGDHGSPVVLFHGFSGSAEGNWVATGIATLLAKHHRVYALDQRGHGLSDKPREPGRYGIVRLSQDGVELLDHLHLRRAHLAGYSMGGSVVQGVMLLAPKRAITATFGGSGSPEIDPVLAARAAKLDPAGVDPLAADALAAFNALPGRDLVALGALQMAPPPPAGTPDFDPQMVSIPVLAIVGEFDRPYSMTERMKREMRDFRRVILPERAHITAPADPGFAKAMSSFIDAHDDP